MNESIEKTIDIEKILRDKMGKKARYVPRFVISWLKKIIHEDEVNRFLWENRKLEGTEWLTACVQYLDMTLDIVGAVYFRFQSSFGWSGRCFARLNHRPTL